MSIMYVLLLLLCILPGCTCSRIFAGVFPNWVQSRHSPFKFSARDLEGIVGRLDHLKYAYASFSTDDYQIKLTDEQDEESLQILMDYKSAHPQLKILLSIGGENFPSSYFSHMVNSNQTISWFVDNLRGFLEEHNFDGVDISWKWPCSKRKTIHRKRYEDLWKQCDDFEEIYDGGGSCPGDDIHLLYLLHELRQDLGNSTIIAVTGTRDPRLVRRLPLRDCSEYVDYWYVESFGYTVPDTNRSYVTGPFAPLKSAEGTGPDSINATVMAYLEAGVPPDKLIVGISLYGGVWYIPHADDHWQEFGTKASVQGWCCGPFRSTFGGKPGQGSRTCGLYMSSEIQAVRDMQYYYDKQTQTAIGYLRRNSSDGWTEEGTWISYSDRNSVQAITQYIKKNNLAGAFVSDVAGDTIDFSKNEFTFELMGAIYSGLRGGTSEANVCNPAVGCNVCGKCCRTYLTNQFDCDACVTIRCTLNVCYPPLECNVCPLCCSRHHASQSQCNFCVESKCKL